MKVFKLYLSFALCCSIHILFAQNKDVDKGKEILAKAFDQKDPVKKNEMIQKSLELFQKGGLKKEMNHYVGDAFLEHNDLTQASSYYNRCDKVEKADGLKKVAAAYEDLAFSVDEKAQGKNLKSAIGFYQKSGALKEGASGIANKFFDKGEKYYDQALDYYTMAQDTAGIEKVATTYKNKGGSSIEKAIELYKKIGTKDALNRGGSLAFEKKNYTKAYECYSAAENLDGLDKVAQVYYNIGLVTEADNIYVKMVETYMKTANTEEVERLGTQNVSSMNYKLAARIYDKAGNMTLSRKYYAYSKIMVFDFDSAKALLNQNDEPGLAKAIDKDMMKLMELNKTYQQFEDYIKQQPYVGTELDPVSGIYKPLAKDESMLVDYYKNIKDQIVEGCHNVSKYINTISDSQLKGMLKKRFLEYPAINKVLDPFTFNIKLQKSTAQVKDVYLKRL